MSSRIDRHKAIRDIVSRYDIESQEQLRELLVSRKGIDVTQATLSRDLKQMKIAKSASPKGYLYILPRETGYRRDTTHYSVEEQVRRSGFVSFDMARAMAVIRTKPGMAQRAALEIESLELPFVAGTVAGQDTVFVALRESKGEKELKAELSVIIPNIV